MKKYSNIIKNSVAEDYLNNEKFCDIAKKYSLNRTTLSRFLKKKGVVLRGNKKINVKNYKNIIRYYKNGKKTKDIALKYNVTRNNILYILHSLNCFIRPNNEECRKYKIKENFFNNINSEIKAYAVGLLFSDGCNSKNKQIFISFSNKEDSKVLIKIARAIYYNPPVIKGYKPKKSIQKIYKLCILNKHIAEKLYKLGCIPRKSLTLQWPLNIPYRLLRHFIRGYFDGDGSIFVSKNKRRAEVCIAGTFKFIKKLSNFLYAKKIKNFIYKTASPSGKTFELRFSSKNSINNFKKLIYKRSTIFFSRKNKKFDKIKYLPDKKTSRFRGVSYIKNKNKWKATCWVNNKNIYLGYYFTEKEAHKAHENFRDRLSKRHRFN